MVVRHDVDLGRPRPVVDRRAARGHEVRRDRLRGVPPDRVALEHEALEQRVGAEPLEVEPVRRVRHARRLPRGIDLVPGAVDLAPERRAPRGVERVERPVAPLEPGAEVRDGCLVVAVGDRSAVLVVHVPHHDGGVVRVPLGELLGDRRAARRYSGLLGETMPREPNPSVTPSRVTGRACGYAFQNHAGGTVVGVPRSTSMPAPREQVEHLVEEREVVLALARLEQRPGEDADAHEVDAGLAHELDVLEPGLARPLLGVVVAAEADRGGAGDPAAAGGGVPGADAAAASGAAAVAGAVCEVMERSPLKLCAVTVVTQRPSAPAPSVDLRS